METTPETVSDRGGGIQEFDRLTISTQTVIADSGLTMDIEEFFRSIPVDDLPADTPSPVVQPIQGDPPNAPPNAPPNRRSRKTVFVPTLSPEETEISEILASPTYQVNELSDPDLWIRLLPHVRCRAMYYRNEIKIHPCLRFPSRERYFRNALNVVLSLGTKLVNFKLSKNGKFQLTGCKYLWHAQVCVVAFLHRIRLCCPERLPCTMQVYFQTVMTNKDFNLGHTIDRSRLDEKINTETPYYSLLETSFGYTGVNIKFPIPKDWWTIMRIPVVTLTGHNESPLRIHCEEKILDHLLKDTDRQRLQAKSKYNTFLVFHSGNVIMSGMSPQLMKIDYQKFTGLLTAWSKEIRETIHP